MREEITLLVLRAVPTESTYFTPPNQIFGLIGNVCQFIEGHLYSEITVAQIAEHFAITRCHLTRVFKQKVGLSPNQYILLLRLREAECLVEQGISLV
ncbi:MAG: AraC-like DNA-binding protein [Glaciecola sp.]